MQKFVISYLEQEYGKTNMWIIAYKKIILSIISILSLGAVFSLVFFGLTPGIDFTGGTLLHVAYSDERPLAPQIEALVESKVEGGVSIRETGENGYIIRTKELTPAEQFAVLELLKGNAVGDVTLERATTIGPTIGAELAKKSLYALLLVVFATLLYVAYAFRGVTKEADSKIDSGPSSWWYGLIVLITLLHDVLMPAGVFALLGHFAGVEIDTLFVTALLVILGYSINDTIIIFDRVRENVLAMKEKGKQKLFTDIVGESLSQTYVRSINTSLTTLLVLCAIFIFAGESTKLFSLALIIGVFAGTYSSILFSAPLLAFIHERQTKKRT